VADVDAVFYFFMKLKINGEEKEIGDGLSIAALLDQLQVRPARVVVERNREIVPRDTYGSILLSEGDMLEIVHFVGGG
jgi:thiamine biosynthesis protein ThiS